MPECDGCGAHVTSDWARVYGVNGVIPACYRCTSGRGVSDEIREYKR